MKGFRGTYQRIKWVVSSGQWVAHGVKCYTLTTTHYPLYLLFAFYLLLFSFPAVGQWRVGFEAGVAVPMGATGLRSCFAADLKGEWAVWSDECGVMSDEELGIRNDGASANSSFITHHSSLKISVGHLRTLETLGPDYGAVPTDTASYQRRFIVYPVTVGGGYEWTVWSDECGVTSLKISVSAEVGVALCYEKWRRVLSMTATDVWLEDMGLTGWVPAARVDAEVRLWDHVGLGVGVRWIGGKSVFSDQCSVFSSRLNTKHLTLNTKHLKNITEHVDRKRGELGGFGGAMWSVGLRYWF